METPQISIVIPAYNESGRISLTLEKIINYFRASNAAFEIIVVDDGSADGTADVARSVCDRLSFPVKIIADRPNRGKGCAVKTGMLAANGEYVLFTDADLSTPIEEFAGMKKEIDGGCDIVIGSRALKDSLIALRQPFYREWMGKIFNLFMRLIVGLNYRDTQCGFKLFNRRAATGVFGDMLTSNFAFDVEALLIAQRRGFKIKELPVKWLNSPVSRVHILRDSFAMFSRLLALRRLYHP
ncbi:MAG: hypothetical protein A2314_02640 [Elusimicrobia bacterium RIFOXYB2_FULL_50_12]|nr:MAG: hypothetical protein A2314_02640 [Elusimicrobia bacterium RIFOXYB2_FULL_50_12]